MLEIYERSLIPNKRIATLNNADISELHDLPLTIVGNQVTIKPVSKLLSMDQK